MPSEVVSASTCTESPTPSPSPSVRDLAALFGGAIPSTTASAPATAFTARRHTSGSTRRSLRRVPSRAASAHVASTKSSNTPSELTPAVSTSTCTTAASSITTSSSTHTTSRLSFRRWRPSLGDAIDANNNNDNHNSSQVPIATAAGDAGVEGNQQSEFMPRHNHHVQHDDLDASHCLPLACGLRSSVRTRSASHTEPPAVRLNRIRGEHELEASMVQRQFAALQSERAAACAARNARKQHEERGVSDEQFNNSAPVLKDDTGDVDDAPSSFAEQVTAAKPPALPEPRARRRVSQLIRLFSVSSSGSNAETAANTHDTHFLSKARSGRFSLRARSSVSAASSSSARSNATANTSSAPPGPASAASSAIFSRSSLAIGSSANNSRSRRHRRSRTVHAEDVNDRYLDADEFDSENELEDAPESLRINFRAANTSDLPPPPSRRFIDAGPHAARALRRIRINDTIERDRAVAPIVEQNLHAVSSRNNAIAAVKHTQKLDVCQLASATPVDAPADAVDAMRFKEVLPGDAGANGQAAMAVNLRPRAKSLNVFAFSRAARRAALGPTQKHNLPPTAPVRSHARADGVENVPPQKAKNPGNQVRMKKDISGKSKSKGSAGVDAGGKRLRLAQRVR